MAKDPVFVTVKNLVNSGQNDDSAENKGYSVKTLRILGFCLIGVFCCFFLVVVYMSWLNERSIESD